MNRSLTPLAIAAFAAAAFLAPAAQACISCNYTPAVVNTPVHSWGGGGGGSYSAKSYAGGGSGYVEKKRKSRRIEKEVVEKKQKPRKIETAKAPAKADKQVAAAKPPVTIEKPVETAKVEPAETKPAVKIESENCSIATASNDPAPEVSAKPEPKAAGAKTAVSANANVGCKKFFPTVGMTLTVPCE